MLGGIAGGNPHLADALRSASLHVDATAWVTVMRPEPGATRRAAREVFDVFLVRAVFTLGRALPALGLGVSVILIPNRYRCGLVRLLITVDQLDRKLVVFSNSEL
jgi:hypothetical protein